MTVHNMRNPALQQDGNGVTDRSAGKGEGERTTAIQAGDWCWLLSTDGVQQNVEPYLVASVETGSDGQPYARFLETDTGWLLAQCERTDPPATVAPPDDVEEF